MMPITGARLSNIVSKMKKTFFLLQTVKFCCTPKIWLIIRSAATNGFFIFPLNKMLQWVLNCLIPWICVFSVNNMIFYSIHVIYRLMILSFSDIYNFRSIDYANSFKITSLFQHCTWISLLMLIKESNIGLKLFGILFSCISCFFPLNVIIL